MSRITQPVPSLLPQVTFGQLESLALPSVLPSHSVPRFAWERLVTLPSFAEHLTNSETIPHLTDLQPILRDLEVMKDAGYTAVRMTVRLAGALAEEQFVSLNKIRLMVSIHNNMDAINFAKALYSIVSTHSSTSATWEEIATALKSTPIQSLAVGFLSSVPLWSIGCLAWEPHEYDVFDTVVDLRLEATALQLRLFRPNQPEWVLCPSMFIHSLRQLFGQPYQHLNTELRSLQHHICKLVDKGQFAGIVFLDCDGSHWVSYLYDGSSVLRYGDSLDQKRPSPDSTLQAAFNWFLGGTGLPKVQKFVAMKVSTQDIGSRSCALAAFNAAELWIGVPGVKKWNSEEGDGHRLQWVKDILAHHTLALPFQAEEIPWYGANPAGSPIHPDGLGDWNNSYAWECWNIRSVEAAHPFCQVIRSRMHEPKKSLPYMAPPEPLELDGHPSLDEATRYSWLSPSPELSSSINSNISRSPLTDPSVLPDQNGVTFIDLTHSSPPQIPMKQVPAKRVRGSSIVVLSSDEEDTFSRTSTKRTHRGGKNKRSRRRSSSVIILSDSDGSVTLRPWKGHADDIITAFSPSPLKARSTAETPPESLGMTESTQSLGSPTEPSYDYPPTSLQLHQIFSTLDEAIKAVLSDAESRRIVMRHGQKFDDDSGIKVTVQCQCYQKPQAIHNPAVHPGNQRRGRSNRTGCMAHVNINRMPGSSNYYLTLINDIHNHPPILPLGGQARRAPTEGQWDVISRYATQGSFNRRHVQFLLSDLHASDRPLEARQISNAISTARRQARKEIAALGGDVTTILQRLEELKEEDPRWRYRSQFSENGTLVALWWQSPEQADLLSEYPDVLINDCTYNRNQYGYPLNIGVGVDHLGHSRNLWYAFHAREDAATHEWVLQNHLDHSPRHPDVFASDRDAALESVVPRLMPTTYHIICLHHMEGNLTTNLHARLSSSWDAFLKRFWEVYRAVSLEIFETLWQQLLCDYPASSEYLSSNLYPIRRRWAHAWTACHFTAGIRTNGRVESENRTNKILGGPKTTLLQLFENLNQRTRDQVERERQAVRNSSRQQHPRHWEPAFARVITLCETYLGGFGLETVWREMEKSCSYRTEVIPVPHDLVAWAKTLHQREAGFQWAHDEEKRMINRHENDGEYIALPWLLHQVTERRLDVRFVVRVSLRGTSAQHIVLILSHDRHLCDCCMAVNLGLPCQHYFAALSVMVGMQFHLSIIRQRWLRSSDVDPSKVPPVTLDHAETQLLPIAGSIVSNPLHILPASSNPVRRDTPANADRTLAPQEINHRTQSALKVATCGITTQAQLERFMGRMAEIEEEQQQHLRTQQPMGIRDPPALNPRGRPRTTRLAAAREGAQQAKTRSQTRIAALNAPQVVVPHGSQGAPLQQENRAELQSHRRCGKCRRKGHNRRRCPN